MPAKKAKPKKKAAKAKPQKRAKKIRALVLKVPDVIPPGADQEEPRRGRGRPSEYAEETATAICDRMVNGESLRSICRDDYMPDAVTVFRWMEARPEFRKQYVRAREMQAELLAEEIIEISDTAKMGVRRKMTPRGLEIIEGDMVERSKLMVDARKWAASRLLPKRYGTIPPEKSEEKNEALQAMIDAINSGPVTPGEVNEQ